MSELVYTQRAQALLDAGKNDAAGVNATLAVARAAREIDDKLKYVAKQISDAVQDDSERWLSWEIDGQHEAIAVRHIVRFAENATGSTLVVTTEDDYIVPLSYGNVALQVGA